LKLMFQQLMPIRGMFLFILFSSFYFQINRVFQIHQKKLGKIQRERRNPFKEGGEPKRNGSTGRGSSLKGRTDTTGYNTLGNLAFPSARTHN